MDQKLTNQRVKYVNDIILALLFSDKDLEKKDIFIKGFISVYFDDIERPYLDNHVFIMYDTNEVDGDYVRLLSKIENMPNYYSSYNIMISGVWYKVFCFTLNPKHKKEFDLLKKGKLTRIKSLTKSIILEYNFDEISDLSMFMSEDIPELKKIIPEQDFIPEME